MVLLAVNPDSQQRREAMFKNNKLRLLMTLVGFQRLGLDEDVNASWIIPSSVESSRLSEALESIKRYEAEALVLEDGRTAEDYIRRKTTARPRGDQEGASADDDNSEGDDDFQFPSGGPTTRKSDALEELKAARRRKRRDAGEDLSDTEREARRKARQEKNARMQRKVKSDLFVHGSDDEDNEERDKEFFAKEEERRRAQGRKVLEALTQDDLDGEDDVLDPDSNVDMGETNKKRRSTGRAAITQKQKRRKTVRGSLDENGIIPSPASDSSSPQTHLTEEEQDEPSDTPLSSPHPHLVSNSGVSQRRSASPFDPLVGEAKSRVRGSHKPTNNPSSEDDGDGDDQPMAIRKPRMRAGFVIDSDSE